MPCPFATTMQILLGGIGDGLALTLSAPLTKLSLHLQVDSSLKLDSSVYTTLISKGGGSVWSLWHGNGLNFWYTVLLKNLHSYLQHWLSNNHESIVHKYLLRSNTNSKTDKEKKLDLDRKANLLAGCSSLAILFPLNLAVTCFTLDHERKPSDGSLQSFWAAHPAWTSLYHGLFFAISSYIVQTISYWNVTERFTPLAGSYWTRWSKLQGLSLLSTTLAYPLETISKRRQLGNDDTGNLFAGLSIRIMGHLVQQYTHTVYNSGPVQDVVRNFTMKYFH